MTKLEIVPNVDFNIPNKGGKQILLSKSIDTEQHNFLGIPKYFKYTFHKIWIEYQIKSPDIIINNPNELIKIRFLGAYARIPESDLIKDLLIKNDPNVHYNIVFNPDVIVDCTDLDLERFTIECRIKFQKDAKKPGDTITLPFTFNVALRKAIARLSQQIEYGYTLNDGFEYRNDPKQLIGNLILENKCPFRYSTTLDLSLSLRFDREFSGDIMYWGDVAEIQESNPYSGINPGIREVSEELDSLLEKDRNDNGSTLTLRKIVAKNKITIPFYCDLTRIGNPTSNSNECSFAVSVTSLIDGKEENWKNEFLLYQDTRKTQLKTQLKIERKIIDINNGDSIYAGKYKWKELNDGNDRRFAGRTNLFSILIGNLAEETGLYQNASVYIYNAQLTISYFNGDGTRNIIGCTESDNLIDLIRIQRETDFLPFMAFLNAPNSYVDSQLYFQHQSLSDIIGNVAHLKVELSFDYYEDMEGDNHDNETDKQPFRFDINFYIEKDPGAEWLCVDFGTSAIVAAFGNGDTHSSLIDLQARYKEVLEQNVQSPRFRKPRFEEGTKFLSSHIIFNNNGTLTSRLFKENLIWLSPSESQFDDEHRFILPFIKALVGHRELPNIDKYEDFVYLDRPGGNQFKFIENPLSVDEIFVAIYKSLFIDYILPAIGNENQRKANKLIATIPNTYTPRHIDYIRKIINENFRFIRKDYVRFLSESDAVASYYLSNWQNLNIDRDKDIKEQLNKESEYVLVYDMGAGTLDLTYLAIHRTNATHRTVDILAKIGINKAGNYLDYIIAKAVIENCNLPEGLLSPQDAAMGLQSRALKVFVRNEVKPKMFSQDTVQYEQPADNNGIDRAFDIDCVKLREHEEIQGFIKDSTHELLENFFTVNGYTKGHTKIDTVIFTGRSVQFADVKERVKAKIDTWNGHNPLFPIEVTGDALKSIVVDGALQFAALYSHEGSIVKVNTRNIYASYGLIYKDVNGNIAYKELISPTTKPVKPPKEGVFPEDGISVYEYDSDIYCADGSKNREQRVDLRGCPLAFFVQNFSIDPVRDWTAGHREYITEMNQFSPQGVVANAVDLNSVHVRIQVNSKNEMIFSAGTMQNDPTDPLIIDVESNETFKQSMWPYLSNI